MPIAVRAKPSGRFHRMTSAVPSSNTLSTTGARLVVDALLTHGVERVFCVPGESFLAILDSLHDETSRIQTIVCRHEAAAANMAEAIGKLTGRPGVALVTRGPGATHASIGVHKAFHIATSGRPGPVVLAFPEDVLSDACEAVPGAPRYQRIAAAPAPAQIARLNDMLVASKKPFVIAGGSGWTPEAPADFARFV